jgi:hypothetical protein
MIDHEAEKTEALPHELGCFEEYAELLIEAGEAETGEHDEILPSGMTVVARFHMEMTEATAECTCRVVELV